MSKDKIDIPVDLDLGPAARALNVLKSLTSPMNFFGGSLKGANTHLDKLHAGLSQAASLTNQMANMSPEKFAELSPDAAAAAADQIKATQAASETMLASVLEKWIALRGGIDKTIDSMVELQGTTSSRAAEQAIERLRGRVDSLQNAAAQPVDVPALNPPPLTISPNVDLPALNPPPLTISPDVDMPALNPPPLTISPDIDMPALDPGKELPKLPAVMQKAAQAGNIFDRSMESTESTVKDLQKEMAAVADLADQAAKATPQTIDLSSPDAAAAKQQLQSAQVANAALTTSATNRWFGLHAAIASTVGGVMKFKAATVDRVAEQALTRLRGVVNSLRDRVSSPIKSPEVQPAQQPAAQPPPVVSGGAAAVAGVAAAAQLTAAASAGKLSSSMQGVRKVFADVQAGVTAAASTVGVSMRSMRDSVRQTQSEFDLFRAARAAPDVDQDLNLIKTGLDKAGAAAAGFINKARATADAVADGMGDSLLAAAAAANKVSGAIDDVTATTAKYEWKIVKARKALGLLGNVLRPLKGLTSQARTALDEATAGADKLARSKVTSALDGMKTALAAATEQAGQMGPTVQAGVAKIATAFDALNASVESGELSLQDAALQAGEMAARLSALGMVATGTFEKGGGSAQIFGRAMYFAALPARLLTREFLGSNRIVSAYHATVSGLFAPLRAVGNFFRSTHQDAKLLNKTLENKPFLYRAAAKSMYVAHRALTPFVAVAKLAITPVRLLGRGVAAMGGMVKTGARNVGSAVKNLIMFGRTSVEAGSAASNLAASAGNVSAALIGVSNAGRAASRSVTNIFIKNPVNLMKQLVGSRLAMAGLAAAAITWGSANAIATETATTQFGTLLGDMNQGKALIQEITGFSAKTPFSNEALRESASLLLAAKVPADQVTNRLQMLGDIAAGTNKPLNDFASIFQKVANTDTFGLDQINQLAERGVPIYSALQDTLGVTRDELMDMVSSGALGFAQMDAALNSLTTGTGMFAGGMAAQSETVAGLWSTLKDNVGIALETVMSVFMEGAKPILATTITITQGVTAALERVRPVVAAWFAAIKAYVGGMMTVWQGAFGLITGVVSSAFAMIGVSGESTFSGILELLVTFAAMAQFTFENFPLAAAIAFDATTLFFVGMANDIGYFFTAQLPAYLDWFGNNWFALFRDAASFVATFATNIVTNITNAWSAIWDYITGKSDSLVFDWTPLTEGFQSTVEELPNIPDRALTDLEKRMTADLDAMKAKFGEGMTDAVADALQTLEPPPPVELKSTIAKSDAPEEPSEGETKQQGRTDFVVNRLEKGSAEELKAIFAASTRNKTPEAQLKEQKTTNKHLAAISDKPELVFEIAPGVG